MQGEEAREWLLQHWENSVGSPSLPEQRLPVSERLTVLRRLQRAEMVDHMLGRKRGSTKRYSLEGTETMVSAVEYIMEELAAGGVQEVVIGMPHR